MSTPSSLSKSIVSLACLALVCAFPAISSAVRPKGVTPDNIGLADGQTLRFTVSNLDAKEPGRHERPLEVAFTVWDSDGNIIAESAPETVPPGRIVSFDLDKDSLPAGLPLRIQLRGLITFFTDEPLERLPVWATLEVFDNLTGKTTVLANVFRGAQPASKHLAE